MCKINFIHHEIATDMVNPLAINSIAFIVLGVITQSNVKDRKD